MKIIISFLLAFLLSANPVEGSGRYFDDATFSNALVESVVTNPTYPMSFFACFRTDTGSTRQVITWYGDKDNTGRYNQIEITATNTVAVNTRNTTEQITATTGTVSTNTWYCAVGTFNNSSDRTIYWQSEAVNGAVDAGFANAHDRFGLGRRLTSSQGSNMSGDICWGMAWSALLNAAEASALLSGANPMRVRPLDRTGAWPLWAMHSPEINIGSSGAYSLTLTGTSETAGGCPVAPWNN